MPYAQLWVVIITVVSLLCQSSSSYLVKSFGGLKPPQQYSSMHPCSPLFLFYSPSDSSRVYQIFYYATNHLIFGLPLSLVVYNLPFGILLCIISSDIPSTCPSQLNLCDLMNFIMSFLCMRAYSSLLLRILQLPSSLTGLHILRNILHSNDCKAALSFSVKAHISDPYVITGPTWE